MPLALFDKLTILISGSVGGRRFLRKKGLENLSNKLKVIVEPSEIPDDDVEALQNAIQKAVLNALIVKKSFSPCPSKKLQVQVVIETPEDFPTEPDRALTEVQKALLNNLHREKVVTEYDVYDYNNSHIHSERFR